MKILSILFLLFYSEPNVTHIRTLYLDAGNDEVKARELVKETEMNYSGKILYRGYYGAGKIILAKYAGNPFTKLSLFKEGKSILESAITKDTSNVELRYLRLTIQINSPKFLGYNNMIGSDKKYLSEEIKTTSDKELSQLIKNFLETIK